MPKTTITNELKLQVLKIASDLTLTTLKASKPEKLTVDELANRSRSLFSENYDLIAEKVGLGDEPANEQMFIVTGVQKPETEEGTVVKGSPVT